VNLFTISSIYFNLFGFSLLDLLQCLDGPFGLYIGNFLKALMHSFVQ